MYVGLHVQYRRHYCQILMKLGFSRQIFEKYLNMKFHENLPVGAELFHKEAGRTDGQTRRN